MNTAILRTKKIIDTLRELIVINSLPIDGFQFAECGYTQDNFPPEIGWKNLNEQNYFYGKEKHFWLKTKLKTPSIKLNETLNFNLTTGKEGGWDANNPQCLVFLNGYAAQGMDVNHTDLLLESEKDYELWIYFYSGTVNTFFEIHPSLKIKNNCIEALYYDLFIAHDACQSLQENDRNYIEILKQTEIALSFLDLRQPYSEQFFATILKSSKYLQNNLYIDQYNNTPTVACIGHTHIDIAWLWTIAQTREKVQRTFATVLQLMNEYPEYKFMSSQPQLYQYFKETQPKLYEQIKQKVKEGRWEVEGAMWVEADCNLPSGESLVRQILHGKRFIKQEFDVDSKILWLPDVFGYSAALPQILKKSGVDKFVTSKISWNDTNQIPYDIFLWKGLDGSEIFTYFLTGRSAKDKSNQRLTTYVCDIDAGFALGTFQRNQQKEYNEQTIITFGHGDGGGGPTKEMLERQRRLKNGLYGIPKTEIKTATAFLNEVKSDFDKNIKKLNRTPRWCGELYLEKHRGTYTSIAEIKKNNRESENFLAVSESLSSICLFLLNKKYAHEKINELWKLLLLNQFHDIVPGSSISEVYEESAKQFNFLKNSAKDIINANLKIIAENLKTEGGYLIYNPNSFIADGFVLIDGKAIAVQGIPAFGYNIIKSTESKSNINVNKDCLENQFLKINFDINGNIVSIYDKEYCREVIQPNCIANELIVFEDLPFEYDAWDINDYYKLKSWKISKAEIIEIKKEGARVGFSITRRYLNSVIRQNIFLYENSRKIDFDTNIDWREEHQLLKTFFPINVQTNKVTYEIQFGNIERASHFNTSWDASKFEVCAQRWADVADGNYGVSLINNCKYGYSAEGSTIALTLLKCATYPNPNADKGLHSFTYTLLPHTGNYRNGGTIKEAYLLNRPLVVKVVQAQNGCLDEEFSFIRCDQENIIIETIKKAEDSDDIIVRLYDAFDVSVDCSLLFGIDIREAYLCDLMENNLECLQVIDNKLSFTVKNFEIITLKICK